MVRLTLPLLAAFLLVAMPPTILAARNNPTRHLHTTSPSTCNSSPCDKTKDYHWCQTTGGCSYNGPTALAGCANLVQCLASDYWAPTDANVCTTSQCGAGTNWVCNRGGCRNPDIDKLGFPRQDCDRQAKCTGTTPVVTAPTTPLASSIRDCNPLEAQNNTCPQDWSDGFFVCVDAGATQPTAWGCRSTTTGPFPTADCANQCKAKPRPAACSTAVAESDANTCAEGRPGYLCRVDNKCRFAHQFGPYTPAECPGEQCLTVGKCSVRPINNCSISGSFYFCQPGAGLEENGCRSQGPHYDPADCHDQCLLLPPSTTNTATTTNPTTDPTPTTTSPTACNSSPCDKTKDYHWCQTNGGCSYNGPTALAGCASLVQCRASDYWAPTDSSVCATSQCGTGTNWVCNRGGCRNPDIDKLGFPRQDCDSQAVCTGTTPAVTAPTTPTIPTGVARCSPQVNEHNPCPTVGGHYHCFRNSSGAPVNPAWNGCRNGVAFPTEDCAAADQCVTWPLPGPCPEGTRNSIPDNGKSYYLCTAGALSGTYQEADSNGPFDTSSASPACTAQCRTAAYCATTPAGHECPTDGQSYYYCHSGLEERGCRPMSIGPHYQPVDCDNQCIIPPGPPTTGDPPVNPPVNDPPGPVVCGSVTFPGSNCNAMSSQSIPSNAQCNVDLKDDPIRVISHDATQNTVTFDVYQLWKCNGTLSWMAVFDTSIPSQCPKKNSAQPGYAMRAVANCVAGVAKVQIWVHDGQIQTDLVARRRQLLKVTKPDRPVGTVSGGKFGLDLGPWQPDACKGGADDGKECAYEYTIPCNCPTSR